MMVDDIDTFRYLVGAYYGVAEMDAYSTKEYVLKDIENYIREFVSVHSLGGYDCYEESSIIEREKSLKCKLQDSLLVLPKVGAPLELIIMVKQRIKLIDEENF